MFHRKDKRVVTQWEHSRLSGELALLLCSLFRVQTAPVAIPELCGAIALHDWPHFAGDFNDTIVVGAKTDEQQRQLVERLSGPLPLNPLAELIVRLHWIRMSDGDVRAAIDLDSVDRLRRDLNLTAQQATQIDGWTEVCDSIAFYIARGQSVREQHALAHLGNGQQLEFCLQVQSDLVSISDIRSSDGGRVEINPIACRVPLLTYRREGYPQTLWPEMDSIHCEFGTKTAA